MTVTLRLNVLQGFVLASLFLAPAVGSFAATATSTATWCQKDTRLREIVLVREVDGRCAVDYNKPFENGLHPRLWRARQDLQFCRDKREELVAKLGRSGWLCSLDFFVHNGRFDRRETMAQAVRSLQSYRSVVAANLEKLSKLETDVSFAVSVGLYQGPHRKAGLQGSEDDKPRYFDVEQASNQAIFLFWTLVHCENASDGTPVYCHYLGFDDYGGPGFAAMASVSSCPTANRVAEAADIFLIGNSRAQNHLVSVSQAGIILSNSEGGTVDAMIRAEGSSEGYRMICAPATP